MKTLFKVTLGKKTWTLKRGPFGVCLDDGWKAYWPILYPHNLKVAWDEFPPKRIIALTERAMRTEYAAGQQQPKCACEQPGGELVHDECKADSSQFGVGA